MLLSEIFSHVVMLESAGLNLSNPLGSLDRKWYPKVINALNLAMVEMHKEFPIKEDVLYVQLQDSMSKYLLHNDYAVQNVTSTATPKFIIDTPSKVYENDLLKIERIFNEIGEEFPLNDEDNEFSLYTPAYNVIQHPYPNSSNAIVVVYRVLPKLVPIDQVGDQYVDLPLQLLNLVLVWMNYKLLVGVNKKDSQDKLAEYLASLQLAKQNGLFRTDETANTKLEHFGWL